MYNLEKCPYCGAVAEQPDWGGCMEMKSGAWQSCVIRCSTQYCMTDVSLSVESDRMETGSSGLYEEILVDSWNRMCKIDGRNK